MAHPLEAECGQLRAELARALATIQRVKTETERAIQHAREAGYEAGLAAAQSQELGRLTMLSSALDDATGVFARRLEELEGLAAQVAQAVLARLLDAPEDAAQLTASFIARQFADLKAAGIVKLYVSQSDFPDDVKLQSVAARMNIDRAQIEIATDKNLNAGEARFECRLGHVELDRNTQWKALERLLLEMGGPS